MIFIFKELDLFDGLLKRKPLIIDNTPLVLKQIRSISELKTGSLYQDVVVDSIAEGRLAFSAKREIVLIIKGEVSAGIDLNRISDEDVRVTGDSISLSLPRARITEVIINPSSVETFYESGNWTNEEITALKLSAKGKLLMAAEQNHLLEKANIKARDVMRLFLEAVGYKKVVIRTL
jgi:hypothetical protein